MSKEINNRYAIASIGMTALPHLTLFSHDMIASVARRKKNKAYMKRGFSVTILRLEKLSLNL